MNYAALAPIKGGLTPIPTNVNSKGMDGRITVAADVKSAGSMKASKGTSTGMIGTDRRLKGLLYRLGDGALINREGEGWNVSSAFCSSRWHEEKLDVSVCVTITSELFKLIEDRRNAVKKFREFFAQNYDVNASYYLERTDPYEEYDPISYSLVKEQVERNGNLSNSRKRHRFEKIVFQDRFEYGFLATEDKSIRPKNAKRLLSRDELIWAAVVTELGSSIADFLPAFRYSEGEDEEWTDENGFRQSSYLPSEKWWIRNPELRYYVEKQSAGDRLWAVDDTGMVYIAVKREFDHPMTRDQHILDALPNWEGWDIGFLLPCNERLSLPDNVVEVAQTSAYNDFIRHATCDENGKHYISKGGCRSVEMIRKNS